MTAATAAAGAGRPASPPMRPRNFAELADEVAATCQRHGVRAWSEDDRDRLARRCGGSSTPTWPDGPADPYTDPDDD